MSVLDRDFLEDYKCRENEYYDHFVKDIFEGKFVLGKDESPYKSRYIKLQRPVAELHRSNESAFRENIWAQIPFNGSSIIALPAFSKVNFEEELFEVKDIPRLVEFVKETGRLQFALSDDIMAYEALDYLDPIFSELKPPAYHLTPMGAFASEEEIQSATRTFTTLADVSFTGFLDFRVREGLVPFQSTMSTYMGAQMTYVTLKLTKNSLAEEAENLLVDDPIQAIRLLAIANIFIEIPAWNLLADSHNYPLDRIKEAATLMSNAPPFKIHFNNEIGKFLLKKLTYAPCSLDACKELMYHYDRYDLQKVQGSLTQAISANNY